jgi:ABC-type sugar transport system substrate-binding protein
VIYLPVMSRRRLLLTFASTALAVQLSLCATSEIIAQGSSDGIRVLAREKSLAEQFLVIMNDFGKNDINQYAKGVVLYAQAKADFDGLITQLEDELVQSKPPNASEKFKAVLEEAVAKRVAFTSFVTDTIIPHTDTTQKSIVEDFIKGGADLIKALSDAGLSIWHEYRSASDTRRNEIKQELETLRWPQFSAAGVK